jgi:cytidylate kinase|tara:strand:+ start:98 stop:793 length:696 start_codon:yes stop_codon:yes gene_type:complete
MLNKIIIAIDGTSSTGKSTIAKRLAIRLKYVYIDSGAMYRALTFYAIQKDYISKTHFDVNKLINDLPIIYIDFKESKETNKFEVHLNGVSVEKHIRSLSVSNLVSKVATIGKVRKQMVKVQHSLGLNKGIVMDGRDIGTVVFPNAELKFYLDASSDLRAKRRFKELIDSNHDISYNEVLSNINLRDGQDMSRKNSPLTVASDSIVINTDDISLDQLENKLLSHVTPLLLKK